jgi:DNA-binding transcriptional MocR family regulator
VSDVGPVAKLVFIEGMARDASLSGLPLRVGIELMYRLNIETGDCWPSITRLANDLGASRRGISKAITNLLARGYFTRQGGGPTKPTHYRPCWKVANHSSLGSEPQFSGVANHSSQEVANPGSQEPVKRNLSNKPNTKNEYFLRFWKIFPNGDGETPARLAFKNALKKVSLDVLLAGAERYAEKVRRVGTKPEFIKEAANWLKEERWLDAPNVEPSVTRETIEKDIAEIERNRGHANP